MPGDSWLAVVLGISGAVAVVALTLVARLARPARRTAPRTADGTTSTGLAGSLASGRRRHAVHRAEVGTTRRRSGLSFRPWSRSRSVLANFERAVTRIDSVDPYAMPRRIGEALADVGLLAPVPEEQDNGPSGHTWPFGPVSGRRRNEDT